MAVQAVRQEARLIDGKAVAETRSSASGKRATASCRRSATSRGWPSSSWARTPASQVYVRNKSRMAESRGFHSVHTLIRDTSEADLLALIARLNADPLIHGILVQLPPPKQIDERRVIAALDPDKATWTGSIP